MSQTTPRVRIIVRSVLLAAVSLIMTAFSAYSYVNRDRMFPFKNTVVVYGRESCGITRFVRAQLASKGIPYVFADVNIPAIDDELWYKLGPRFKEGSITFPVVHVAGRLLLTPTAEQVQEALTTYIDSSSASGIERDYATFLNGADPAPHY